MGIDNYYKRIGDFILTKVDRRILKSQEAIKKAVLELLSEKNFDRITIQDIANRANVSRRTIYLHYTDKCDLMDHLLDTHIVKLREIRESATQLSMKEVYFQWFEYFEKNFLFFSTILASQGASWFRNRLLEFFVQEAVKDFKKYGTKHQELCPEVVLQFFGSASVGMIEWWLVNKMPLSPQLIAEQVGKLLDRMEICNH